MYKRRKLEKEISISYNNVNSPQELLWLIITENKENYSKTDIIQIIKILNDMFLPQPFISDCNYLN